MIPPPTSIVGTKIDNGCRSVSSNGAVTLGCPWGMQCVSADKGFVCICQNGFVTDRNASVVGEGGGRRCADVDECQSRGLECGPNSKCINFPGELSGGVEWWRSDGEQEDGFEKIREL